MFQISLKIKENCLEMAKLAPPVELKILTGGTFWCLENFWYLTVIGMWVELVTSVRTIHAFL